MQDTEVCYCSTASRDKLRGRQREPDLVGHSGQLGTSENNRLGSIGKQLHQSGTRQSPAHGGREDSLQILAAGRSACGCTLNGREGAVGFTRVHELPPSCLHDRSGAALRSSLRSLDITENAFRNKTFTQVQS